MSDWSSASTRGALQDPLPALLLDVDTNVLQLLSPLRLIPGQSPSWSCQEGAEQLGAAAGNGGIPISVCWAVLVTAAAEKRCSC